MAKRESNIELMRIACILLVIAHHYAVHGSWGGKPYNQQILRVLYNGSVVQ